MIIDLIVGVVLLISALIAFFRGLIREVLTIAGVVGGVIAAWIGGPVLNIYTDRWLGVGVEEEPRRLFDLVPYSLISDILSYGLIFLVVVIILSVLSHILAQSAKTLGLGAIDRTLGVIFGLIRGVLLLGLLYLPVYMLVEPDTKTRWFEGSKSHFYLEKTAGWMAGFLPEETKEEVRKETDEAVENLGARKKLQDMDVLRKDTQPNNQEDLDAPGEDKNNDGYSEEFRQKMDQLFEQETRESQSE